MAIITQPMSAGWTGDEEKRWTWEVNFAPASVLVTVAMTGLTLYGEGKGIVGIRRFRVRKADGSEEMTTYGIHGYNWKKRLTGSNICSVTFSIEAVEAVVDGLGIIQTF